MAENGEIIEQEAQSEEQISDKMYQAMADYETKEKGKPTTVEEIKHAMDAVDTYNKQIKNGETPDALSAEDQETLRKMQEYQAEHLQSAEYYAVRGALMRCNHGSHCRRLNLPMDHGSYVLNHPLMCKTDCKAGIEGGDINIPTFGVCEVRKKGETILLKREAPETGNVRGKRCVPDIDGTWEAVHSETHVGENGEGALTTLSYLICNHGGIIEILRSGQEDSDD